MLLVLSRNASPQMPQHMRWCRCKKIVANLSVVQRLVQSTVVVRYLVFLFQLFTLYVCFQSSMNDIDISYQGRDQIGTTHIQTYASLYLYAEQPERREREREREREMLFHHRQDKTHKRIKRKELGIQYHILYYARLMFLA